MAENLDWLSILEERMPPFSKLLGMRFLSAVPERVVAEMLVRPELCTTKTILHGGAIMAFADTLGACATVINLRAGSAQRPSNPRPTSSRRGWWERKLQASAWPYIEENERWPGRPG